MRALFMGGIVHDSGMDLDAETEIERVADEREYARRFDATPTTAMH